MNAERHVVCPHCQGINRIPATRLADDPRCGACHRPLFDGRPLELNAANFRRHLDGDDLPVVVDFWAPWCGPCRALAPTYAQAAAQFATRARLAKLNTEEQPAIAAQYGIRGIPTLILFRRGREVDRVSGALPGEALRTWIEQRL